MKSNKSIEKFNTNEENKSLLNKSSLKENVELNESSNIPNSDTIIESEIEKIGYGYYQILILLLSGIILFIEGVFLTFMSNMIIPLKKYYQASEFEIQLTSGIIFIGVGIGSFSIGNLVRRFQRISILRISIMIIILFQGIVTIKKSIILFIICRFFIGLALGINVPLTLNILCEYLPKKFRQFFLNFIWISFSIGQIYVCILMIILIPNFEEEKVYDIQLGILITITLIYLVYLILIEDSPRNLYMHGHDYKANAIIEKIYRNENMEMTENKLKLIKNYLISGDNLDFKTDSLQTAFSPIVLRTTIILIFVWMINSIISYGSLIIYSETLQVFNLTSENNRIIVSLILVAIFSSTNTFIFPILIEVRLMTLKTMMIFSYFICFLINILIIFFPKHFEVLSCLSLYFIGSAFNLSTTYTIIIYPTKVRDNILGFLFMCTRIGGFTSQFIYLLMFNHNVLLPYYFSIGVLLCTSILVYFLQFDPYGNESLDREIHIPMNKEY